MCSLGIKCVLVLLAFSQAASAGPLRDRIKAALGKKQEASEAVSEHTISIDGIERTYLVHLPKNHDAGKATPLVLALHGGGGSAKIQSKEEYYHLISKSDEAGFIAVFPNGYSRFPSGILATWNAGNCCGNARDKKVDDVKFLREVVKQVSAKFKVDPKRVYATGMSNGGMMSYRLACEMADVLAGIASVAGTDGTLSCSPSRPISLLHIHAKNDDHVLFNGGAGENAFRDKSKVAEFTSVPATIEKWVKLNGCAPSPKRVLEKEGVYCDEYSGCKNDVHVKLCVTEDGGHSWPGGKKPRDQSATPSTRISANDVIWEFFGGSR